MGIYNTKQNFTAGEVSPLLYGRYDFERHRNGCKVMRNMFSQTQGPTTRRSGTEFIKDLGELGLDMENPIVRQVSFVFNELQAYVVLFFMHTDGDPRAVFGVNGGLLTYPASPTLECPAGNVLVPPPVEGDIIMVTFPTGWDIEAFDYVQSGDYLYMVQTAFPIHALIRYEIDCWSLEEIAITDQPTDWSDVYGWPETIELFQQRLVVGANNLRRQTIWASRAGDFHHFGSLDPLNIVDADAVTFTLDSGTQNKIQWLLAVKQLHVGTLGNEWTVSGNSQKAITPDGVIAENHTNNGSERIKPKRVGITTLFIERFGRVVNEFTYDYTYDSFKTTDVSILAPHLTESYSMVSWAYQQTPSSIVWAVRSDGALIGLTYQRPHNVIAWHRHDTRGEFKDVCAIPGNRREDEAWFVIKRQVLGEDKYYWERMETAFKSDDSIDGRFLDSHVLYEGLPITEVTGLDHLEGEVISVMVDGATHPDVQVSGGTATIRTPGAHILAGINYISEVSPLLPELSTEQGSSLAREQRILNIHVGLYRSLGMEIGKRDRRGVETVEEVPFRETEDSTSMRVPLYNGLKSLTFMEGYSSEAGYFIRQTYPLPLTVTHVINELEVS